MLNLTNRRKQRYINQTRTDLANRLVGKNRMTMEEREALKTKKMMIKDKFECNNLGDFQNLYPLIRGVIPAHDDKMDTYDRILAKSREVYEETT